MKWKSKITRADFEANATRKRQVFAFLPTYINGYIYWLSYYEVLEFNKIEAVTVWVDGEKLTFKISNWVELSRR